MRNFLDLRLIKKIFLAFCLFLSVEVFANKKVKPFEVNGGFFIQTKSLYRGALTWNKPSFFIGPSFTFYEKFSIRGPSLRYKVFDRKKHYALDFALSVFNDRKPLFDFSGDRETIRNSRNSSLDMSVHAAYKFGYRKAFRIGATLSKDFVEHKSLYFEPYIAFPLAPLTSLKGFLGSGGGSLNKYLYGTTSNHLISHYGVSLSAFIPSVLLPKSFFKGIYMVSLDHTSVTGSLNRRGILLDGKPDNLNLSIRYICKFY